MRRLGLFFYGASRPWFAYPIIAQGIFMILFFIPKSAGCGPPQTANTDGG